MYGIHASASALIMACTGLKDCISFRLKLPEILLALSPDKNCQVTRDYCQGLGICIVNSPAICALIQFPWLEFLCKCHCRINVIQHVCLHECKLSTYS